MTPKTGTTSDPGEARLIAQLEEMERELAAVRRQLDHSQRLATLGTIAGSIAHEFNNILTPVMSYAQMALANPQDEVLVGKALRKAMDGSERASKIASAMLGFVKAEDQGPADVAGDIQQALSCLARDPARDGVRLQVEAPTDLQALISSVSLQHVIMNLTMNAVEAMRPGGGVLTIRAAAEPGEECSTRNTGQRRPPTASDGWIRIEVQDTGRGVPAEVASRAFEPFVTTAHRAEGRQGHGLGLPICKRLIEAAGGSIELTSSPGKGTTVRILVPRTSAPRNGASSGSHEQAA